MTSARLRTLAALLAAAPLPACHRTEPVLQLPACQLPPPQPSALPTLPVVATAGQSQAIHFPGTATGQTVTFDVPAGTESVTIVEQAASQVPLTVSAGTLTVENTPVPLTVAEAGSPIPIYNDVDMPPSSAFQVVNGVTVLDPAAANLSAYFLSSGAWTGALTMPNTSVAIPGTETGAGVPAGLWTVTVGDWAYECNHYPLGCTASPTPSLYDVTVILKPAAAPANQLKVVFHLVTATGLTPSSADLQRVEWGVKYFLNQAGIAATISYADVPAAVSLQYATGVDAGKSSVCDGLGQLVQLAGPGNQLHVFLVDVITESSGGITGFVIAGLDPIVPGPASFGGTPASGVLVSLANLGKTRNGLPSDCPTITPSSTPSLDTCGDDRTAFIVAHEAGHFLGLYHTTEAIGTVVDPIADTSTCFCPVCKPSTATASQCQGVGANDAKATNPYYMRVSDCLGAVAGCGGGDNLMFWLLAPGQLGRISADQAAVMRASPLVE